MSLPPHFHLSGFFLFIDFRAQFYFIRLLQIDTSKSISWYSHFLCDESKTKFMNKVMMTKSCFFPSVLTTEDGCTIRKWPAEHSRESHPKHNFFSYDWSIFVCQFGPNISDFYDLHWVSVVLGFDHTLWFHKFWTFSWKMSLKIWKDVCECICRGQGRRNKKLLVNNLWGLLRSYAIMQMVRRRRICVVIEFEGVSTKK